MKTNAAPLSAHPFVPLMLAGQPLVLKITAVMLGSVFLSVSSWMEVPMVPIPMTMQTYAVALVGALYGWRLGTVTVLAWLAQGMLGFPVLAGGLAGPPHFVGPSGGFLAGFVLAAAVVGLLAERGWTSGLVRGTVAILVGNALILVVGWIWLAWLIGPGRALASGVTPFLLGEALKALLVSVTVLAVGRASLLLR